MTNAEKYLKDGVDIENFTNSLCGFVENWELRNGIKNFLKKEAKPTLTEDERVILNHINVYEFDKLGRAKNGDLYLCYREDKDTEDFWWCNDLFQFIKERRGILY